MKSILISVVGAAAVFVGAVWLVDSLQTFESYYESYQKLEETELMSRGWISRVIPKSSYDIRETYRFDGATVAVRFRFQPGDIKDIESKCTVLPDGNSSTRQYRCQPAADTIVVRLEPNGRGQILGR
ncbi:MAG: hypothetical protein A4E19_10805 [Nitrospira sp. SG-bin1]|nr:MAG: hypothetical protein A4E19_10805 [Nitrospira sp. SG-bin1]